MENRFDSSSNEASPASIRLAPNKSTLHSSPSWSIQGCSKGWRTVTGCFVAINAFIQSCRCVKAMAGPSPWAHLGDGCLDLILVHNCSRRQFLQYLIRVANGSNQISCQRSRLGNDSPFELPFVTVERVCAFKFRSLSSIPTVRSLGNMWDHSQLIPDDAAAHERAHSFSDTDRKPISKFPHKVSSNKKIPESIWCADGELVHHTNVAVFVHRQLLRLYARGPEPLFQDALLGPTVNTDAQSGKLFDAVAAVFARTDRLNDPPVITQFDSN
ncbi:ceramide kinase [Paragonimus westermani]|uniref:Ceramide kinase n=1 Tax=Paragonimus westermani TaxID=34504 RepID=A0A5J4NYB0_9TREM|nr:ceramide kinase [Paragonimus westermani]